MQNILRIKCSALNVDFSSPSPDPLASRRPAQAGVKNGYPPLKSGYFTAIILHSVKTVADRYMLLVIRSTGDNLFMCQR